MIDDFQLTERFRLFRETTEWAFSNLDAICRKHSGTIAVHGGAVLASGEDVEKVKASAKQSGHPPNHIVLINLNSLECCGGLV